MRRAFTYFLPVALLGGCVSFDNEAEPERYMGFDCEQLEQMAEAYRTTPQQLLEENDRTFDDDREEPFSLQRDRRLNADLDKDRRSIALARREKGC